MPSVADAVRAVVSGQVIAYPTEGVWGLGCDPQNWAAVRRILEIKNRPVEKGMILVAGSSDQLAKFVASPPEFPKNEIPTTWLVAHGGCTPDWISGGSDRVAVRITEHPLVAAICSGAETAIVSTSANPAGKDPALSAEEVQQYFGDLIDVIVPGPLGNQSGPSQILDWETKEVIRSAGH